MLEEYKLTISRKTFMNDIDLDSYLPFVDYTETIAAESWCRTYAPTAKVYRNMQVDSTYTYMTYFIIFETKEDMVFYQFSN